MRNPPTDFGHIINSLRTKSAVNPALVFTALCLAGGIPGAIYAPEPFNTICAVLAVVGVITTAFQILFFTFFDRDRLHDEKHVETKMLINAITPMVGDADNIIEIDAEPVLSGNPQLEDKTSV